SRFESRTTSDPTSIPSMSSAASSTKPTNPNRITLAINVRGLLPGSTEPEASGGSLREIVNTPAQLLQSNAGRAPVKSSVQKIGEVFRIFVIDTALVPAYKKRRIGPWSC